MRSLSSICIVAAAFSFLSAFAAAQQPQSSPHVVPGNASWLSDDGTPDYKSFLPISYMILGADGVAIPRVIIDVNDTCPAVVADDESEFSSNDDDNIPQVKLRAVGDYTLPHAFPIKICETKLTTLEQKKAWSNNQIHFDGINNNANMTLTDNPQRFLLVADTGLRIKPKNLGLGNCSSGPTLYGIPQCMENFTQADLTEPVEGDFQGLDKWHLDELMTKAADQNPDVVLYMGDYLYRQGPCPTGSGVDCVGINVPPHFAVSDLPDDVVANFLPGNWGDTWFGWWADFFYPARDLLANAPFIAIRGNHENCARAGHGYHVLLSHEDYPDIKAGAATCPEYTAPFRVPFENEQFLINDDNAITPKDGGIDHFEFIEGACPPPPQDGDPPIVPLVQNRYDDTSQNTTEIDKQLAIFTEDFEKIRIMSESHSTNFYASHRPLFAIACNDTTMVTLDWTMQESLRENTLDRVSAVIGAHMHWLQVLTFVDQELPVQLVVGNGGTKQIPNYVDQATIPGLKLDVGQKGLGIGNIVERGITDSSMFGFTMMDRNMEGNYDVTFLGLETTTNQLVQVDFPLTIQQGPRVEASVTSSAFAFDPGIYTAVAVFTSLLTLLLAV